MIWSKILYISEFLQSLHHFLYLLFSHLWRQILNTNLNFYFLLFYFLFLKFCLTAVNPFIYKWLFFDHNFWSLVIKMLFKAPFLIHFKSIFNLWILKRYFQKIKEDLSHSPFCLPQCRICLNHRCDRWAFVSSLIALVHQWGAQWR